MKNLMNTLETLGFTKQNGLNGLSLNNVAVSLDWSGEEAVVAVDDKQVFSSESEDEIVAFVKNELKIEVAEVEYNDDLVGFIVELKDGRTVQVQFEKETNRSHADFGTYFAVIDKENDYGLNLSDEEEQYFIDWMQSNDQINEKIKELDSL